MSQFGPLLHHFLSHVSASLTASTCFDAAVGVSWPAFTTAHAYVLEGKSWPTGTTVLMQSNLGSAGRTLQDGNTSWDDAVLPVAAMWNQTIQSVSVNTIVNPVVPVAAGDHINSVVFSNSIFGQALVRVRWR